MADLAPPPPLLSPDWYRLAHLLPRLRAGVTVSRHRLRGQTWFMLTDPVSGRHHRFNDLAYGLVGACDGQTSIDAIWSAHVAQHGNDAATQADTIRIFAQAFAANLFAGDTAPDIAAVARRHSLTRSKRRAGNMNPLAFRVPLWDPDRFLARHLHRVQWVFSKPALCLLGALLLAGALTLLFNLGAVWQHASSDWGSNRMLLLMWLAYPLLKALHEMAHAFAVKHFGGEVHAMGVSLMMLTPVPFVDASASIAFTNKHRRMGVAAAGILVEAACASLALPLFLLAEPGLLKDLGFAVVFIGAVSTLAINGNPLLRFDGYHVLCDAAELPNLALRSSRWWLHQLKKRVLRLPALPFGSLSSGEAPWLWAYTPLALVYRWVLLGLLVLVAAQWQAWAGLVALAWVVWLALLQPLGTLLRWLSRSPELRGRRGAVAAHTLAGVAVLAGAALVVPLPLRSHAPGLVWLPDDALARTSSEGFVEELLAADGQTVQMGTPLLRLSNDPLRLELLQAQAEWTRAHIERASQFAQNARRSVDAEEALARLQNTRERLVQRVEALTVKAGVAGKVVLDPGRIRSGQWVAQGEVVAQVLPADAPLVRALVHSQNINLVREHGGTIQVEMPQGGPVHPARLQSQTPRASTQLPSRALGETAGGSVALDSSDNTGRTAREALFAMDLQLPAGTAAPVGARVLVTFDHGSSSAAAMASRFLRQSFLRYFQK